MKGFFTVGTDLPQPIDNAIAIGAMSFQAMAASRALQISIFNR